MIVETSFNCDEDGGLDNQIYIENEVSKIVEQFQVYRVIV